MTVLTKKEAPFVYIRHNIPIEYLEKLRKICSTVIVEPWLPGEPEPEPNYDISKCNVIFTLGMRDKLKILEKTPNLQWIHSQSVGLEAMLTKEVRECDVIVTNTKGCTSIPIAEHTIAMITSLARGVPTMIRNEPTTKWELIPIKDLGDSTVGIIGYGEIGYEIAKRCKGLGMKVIGCRRNPKKQKDENDPADIVVGMDQVDKVLGRSDFLVLALPSTKETRYFLNKQRLKQMKKGSYLINVGRGNTIEEKYLVECLNSSHIAGAALDVFEVEPLPKDHPFWTLDNVIVSPHNAYYSPKNVERNMNLFITNLKLFIEGKPMLNVVDKKLGY
jgi:phosphoglycerate dehydrogenase-like enzyme